MGNYFIKIYKNMLDTIITAGFHHPNVMKEIMLVQGIVLESIPATSYNAFFAESLTGTLLALIVGIAIALFVQFPFFAYPLLLFLAAVLLGDLGLGFLNIFLRLFNVWWRNWFFWFVTWSIRVARRWIFFYA